MPTSRSIPRRAEPLRRDRGQVALPMVLLTLSVVIVAIGVVFVLGRVLVDRSAAQAAADAAALAGVAEGDGAARAIARSNGATVISIHREGTDVVVEVTRGWAAARARAGQRGDP